jgi:SAM-dependent methyltransferase
MTTLSVTDRSPSVDYGPMAKFYDLIMIGGSYYDYAAIAEHLASVPGVRTALELGVGTGLIPERLLRLRAYDAFAGVDYTPAMIGIARDRLADWPQVSLSVQDVTALALGATFDLVFSYGGPWYFVPDHHSWALISHLPDDEANARGLKAAAAHLSPGGRLLLGIQQPHKAYARPLPGGFTYAQSLFPLAGGFRKRYVLTDRAGNVLVDQVTDYRVYGFTSAQRLLAGAGLCLPAPRPGHGKMFLEFAARS